jgi:Domain of unknown function (DUF1918)
MHANVGDELTVHGARGDDDRHGQILEVRGADGAPPYLVRWRDGWDSLLFPWPSVVIEHRPDGDTERQAS